MPLCTKCGKTRQRSKFSKATKRSRGIRPWCKDCEAEHSRDYYHRPDTPPKDRQRANACIAANVRLLSRYKTIYGCSACGLKHPCPAVFDLHHVVKTSPHKKFRWGRVSRRSIKLELRKCVILCAVCHRIAHYDSDRRGDVED